MARLPPLGDTIVAIATAPAAGAVGIVRLSGPQSFAIAARIFVPKRQHDVQRLAAGRVIYGAIIDSSTQPAEPIDEGLLLSFRAPHSYTAEDVIELQVHGGSAILRRLLALCQAQGARLAQAGEFTLRAYLHGRIDLLQAEAVQALVQAQTDTARRHAALGLSAALTKAIRTIQQDITHVYASVQAMLDYPEEGVPEAQKALPLARARQRIATLLHTAQAGQRAQEGARLALVGRPNAGKSSLLNALLGYSRSIVSAQAGTTRDYLEAPLTIAGIPLTIIDTAGIRQTDDPIERSGVAQAKQLANHADLSLVLLDGSQPAHSDDEALLYELSAQNPLIVVTKADLSARRDLPHGAVAVSAHSGEGLEPLRHKIAQRLLGDVGQQSLWLSNARHSDILQRVDALLARAQDVPDDLAALDLQDALHTLAELTGETEVAEDTLARIFANFCVGK